MALRHAATAMIVLGAGSQLAAWRFASDLPMVEQRLMPVVAGTWLALIVVIGALAGALATLFGDDPRADWLTRAITEVGIAAASWVLVFGLGFSVSEWGVWWTWDPRMVSAAVMLLMFVGITLLRAALRDPDSRRPRAAAATILAAVDLPIVYEVVGWWQLVHPVPFEVTSGATLTGGVGVRVAWMAALALWGLGLLAWRYDVAVREGLAETPEALPRDAVLAGPSRPSTTQDQR